MSFLERVVAAMRDAGLEHAIAGGYAVALHGVVRGTIDVDIILQRERADYLKAEAVMKTLGLVSKLPVTAGEVFDFRREYIEKRNLKAWSFVNLASPAEIVDVVITEELSRLKTKTVVVRGLPIRIVAKQDLIAMKRAAGRPQDLEDVRALEGL